MSQPTRLLIVGPSFDILGGQSVQAARLMAHLDEEPSLEVGFLPINPRLPGILRKLQSVKYVRTIVTSIAYIINLLTQIPKYDVVHVFSASYFSFVIAPTPAILISKLYGKKVLLNYHSGEARDHLQRWRRTAIPTIKLVDLVVVPSEYLVRVFSEFGIKSHAIYNLIDTSTFRFREREVLLPAFLSNRNFETHYGVDRVLKAFAIIQQRYPEATLVVAGEGSQRQNLKQLATDLELSNTKFVGQIDPSVIMSLYDSADIYLNASDIDNQPLSILEAFACGLPIVTTGAGGIPDIVADGISGFVVPCGDFEKLAERAIELLQQPELANRMVKQGLAECQKYSWEAVRDGWMQSYESLADKNGENADSLLEGERLASSERKVISR